MLSGIGIKHSDKTLSGAAPASPIAAVLNMDLVDSAALALRELGPNRQFEAQAMTKLAEAIVKFAKGEPNDGLASLTFANLALQHAPTQGTRISIQGPLNVGPQIYASELKEVEGKIILGNFSQAAVKLNSVAQSILDSSNA